LLPINVADLIGVQFDIHNTNQVPIAIDNGECQKTVQDEEFASLENRGGIRDSDEVLHHDVPKQTCGGIQQQSPNGDNAHESILFVDDVEIDNPALHRVFADCEQRFSHRLVHM